MSQDQAFSDQSIKLTIESLTAQGQDVTPWAVQSLLGGGDYLRIQQIIEQHFTPLADPQIHQEFLLENEMAINENRPSSPAIKTESLTEQKVPASIEATMYQMQKVFGDMANKLWNDVAANAQVQVQEEVSKARKTQISAEYDERHMQHKIAELNKQLADLERDLQASLHTIEEEQQQLLETQEAREALRSELTELSKDTLVLEKSLLESSVKAEKLEGLSEITRDKLELAKQSEQQAIKSLERSESRVDALDREYQSTQREVDLAQHKLENASQQREDLSRQLHDTQLRQAAEQALRQEMQERHIPQYPEPNYPPPQVQPEPAAAPAPAYDAPKTPASKPKMTDKSRSLSDKLFERKSRQRSRKS